MEGIRDWIIDSSHLQSQLSAPNLLDILHPLAQNVVSISSSLGVAPCPQ